MCAISFDLMEYEDYQNGQGPVFAELKQRLSPQGRTYLFLDEIQEVKSWEKVAQLFCCPTISTNVDIFVTGSNSRMMSSEISTYLTGAGMFPSVSLPLSFREYLTFRETYTTVGSAKRRAGRLSEAGRFPSPHI